VYANRAGMLTLAKLLIQLSLGEYKNGFHIHLRADFSDDAARPDLLTICLTKVKFNERFSNACYNTQFRAPC
jgi:hypothetical protein